MYGRLRLWGDHSIRWNVHTTLLQIGITPVGGDGHHGDYDLEEMYCIVMEEDEEWYRTFVTDVSPSEEGIGVLPFLVFPLRRRIRDSEKQP